jgi:hypothetical protein
MISRSRSPRERSGACAVVADLRDTEVKMKRSHIAALIAASALGCALPAWAVAPSQDAQDPTVQGHADKVQQESAPMPSAGSSGQSDQSAQSQSDRAQPSKHPPTAVMDRATPPEKSTDEGGDAGKHPPARVMDRAVPEQKSPSASVPSR